MSELARETEESVFLTWLDQLEGIYLSIAESNKSVKFAVSIGTRFPLYIGALGHTIMAFLPEEAQQEIIAKGLISRTAHTITDPKTLMTYLEKAKNQGWLYSSGQYSEEVAGISKPIFDHNNKIVASLTISAPTYRFPEEAAVKVLNKLELACLEIQRNIKTYQISQNIH